MATPETITIKFKPDGHEKLIKALNNINKATQKLTNENSETVKSANKFSSTAANLTAKLKAQNITWKQLGVSSETLRKAYKGNRLAIEQLRLSMKKANDQGMLNVKTNRLLDGTFATIRSQLLLFNFAMALGVRQLGRFASEATKLQSMERAFTTLSGGVNMAGVAIDKLQDATDGTMSQFDLFQQANNAMILGVSKNSDEMAEMFDIAQRLGEALGKDTRMSVESLITGIGRQSRLMLDNIGIIVKADEAYEQYAEVLDTTVDKLTDADKKQAFLNATMESARKKVALLPPEMQTAERSFASLGASIKDAQAEIGEAFIPILVPLADGIRDVVNAMDADRVQRFATAVSLAGASAVILSGGLTKAAKAIYAILIAQTKLGWGAISTAIGLVAFSVLELTDAFEDNTKQADDNSVKMDQLSEKQKRLARIIGEHLDKIAALREEQIKGENSLQKQLDLLNAKTEQEKMLIKLGHEASEKEKELIEQIITKNLVIKAVNEASKVDIDTRERNLEALGREIQKRKELMDALTGQKEKVAEVGESILHQISSWDQLVAAMSGYVDFTRDAKTEAQMAARAFGQIGDAITQLAGKNKDVAIFGMRLSAAAAIADSIAGASKMFAKGGAVGYIKGVALLAQMMVRVNSINAQIRTLQAEKFEQGGLIGGNRHSQGGTMIEAERGEFVMNRNAVQSIGLENLNAMNQGSVTTNSPINISINGGMIDQNFVENDLADAIKTAIRRGSDFGVA